jgi:hypothetical protein
VDGRTDGRQVAELATPDLRRDAANPGDGLEDEVADGRGRSNGGRPGADQVAQPILDLLVAIGDQLLLGRKVVVHRLLGDLGLARHVTDGDMFVAALGEQAGRGVGDEPAGARLLELAQSGAGHLTQPSRDAVDYTLEMESSLSMLDGADVLWLESTLKLRSAQ